MHHYLFDIDGSLFFSDGLNAEGYNYALRKFGYEEIFCEERITRAVIRRHYPQMDVSDFGKVVAAKQDYFINNVMSVRKNEALFDLLRVIGPRRSALWTAGSRSRVEKMLKAFALEDAFSQRFYSSKQDIPADVSRICATLRCEKEKLTVFEDDLTIARRLSECGVSCLVVIAHAKHPCS